MRVITIENPLIYSCKSYYIRGDWNKLDDINTLIDTGSDGYVMDYIQKMDSTGVGKRKIEQVILTHNHFDHAAGLKKIFKEYKPQVVAHAEMRERSLEAIDGMEIKAGDSLGRIIYTPGHSHDSICIYFPEDKILFAGDTQIRIISNDYKYTDTYIASMEKLEKLDVDIVYHGHDDPIKGNYKKIIHQSLWNMNNFKG